jgi:arylsulfatase A-like enzyme
MTARLRLAALVLLAGLAALRPASAAAPERPNVLLVLADDMGIGDVSHLNPASLWRTPHLDRLAREGMVFSDAHSSSGVCTPTRYTLLTGRYSWRGRLKRGVLQGYSPPLMEPGRQTLAGFLQAQGYTTALFGKWHLGLDWARSGPAPEDVDWTRPFGGGPRAHGFDRFLGISASLDMPPYVWLRDDRVTAAPAGRVGDSPAPRLWRAGPIGADFKMEEVQPRLTAETLAFLGERAAARDGRPFFALLSLASPHTPTLATGEFAGSTPTPYGDFVRQVDADFGRILVELDRLGLARNTLVVFTTDNGYGDEFGVTPGRLSARVGVASAGGASTGAASGGTPGWLKEATVEVRRLSVAPATLGHAVDAQMQAGDELWAFEAQWQDELSRPDRRAGYVIWRGGQPVAHILTVLERLLADSDP